MENANVNVNVNKYKRCNEIHNERDLMKLNELLMSTVVMPISAFPFSVAFAQCSIPLTVINKMRKVLIK